MSEDAIHKKWRVKLYELEANGAWLDQGTGFVSCQHVQNIGSFALVVSGEDGSNQILLESKIAIDEVYEKQGDSIVMWRERCPAGDVDYALSFQDTTGCQSVWAPVKNIQQQYRYAYEHKSKPMNGESHHASPNDSGTDTSHSNSNCTSPITASFDRLEENDGIRGSVGYDEDRYVNEHLSQYMYNDDHSNPMNWNMYEQDVYRPSVASPTNIMENNGAQYVPQTYLPTLPEVEWDNIEKIRDLFVGMNSHHREAYALVVIQSNAQFLVELMALFDEIDTRHRACIAKTMEGVGETKGETNVELVAAAAVSVSVGSDVTKTNKNHENGEGNGVTPENGKNSVSSESESVDVDVDAPMYTEEDLAMLRHFAEIARSLLSLNDSAVLQFLVDDADHFFNFARLLEYDSAITDYRRSNYTTYLSNHATRKEVRCYNSKEVLQLDESIISTANRLFRLNYLRDVMMRPNEEIYMGQQSTISSMVTFDSCEIVTYICTEPEYLRELLLIIASTNKESGSGSGSTTESESELGTESGLGLGLGLGLEEGYQNRSDAIAILRELFFISRNLISTKRVELYSILIYNLEKEFFSAMKSIMGQRLLGRSTSIRSDVELTEGYFTVNGLIQGDTIPLGEIVIDPTGVQDNIYVSDKDMLALCECLATFAVICPSILRSTILKDPIPLPMEKNLNNIQMIPLNPIAAIEISCCKSYTKHNLECFLFLILDTLVNDTNNAVLEQISDVIKMLLETERMVLEDRDQFLTTFYEHYISQLLHPFNTRFDIVRRFQNEHQNQDNGHEEKITCGDVVIFNQDSSSISASRRHLCEIMGICVQTHAFRMKNFIIRYIVLGNILTTLSNSHHKHQQVLSLKIFRYIISTKDEAYYRHITRNDHIKVIIRCLQQNIKRNNLISSIVLELLEFIRFNNIKTLIEYIGEKCMNSNSNTLAGRSSGSNSSTSNSACDVDSDSGISSCISYIGDYSDIFNEIKVKYFININEEDGLGSSDSGLGLGQKRYHSALMNSRNQSLYDAENEDAYFNEGEDDDEDEYSGSGREGSGGSGCNNNPLAAIGMYGDDDNEEEDEEVGRTGRTDQVDESDELDDLEHMYHSNEHSKRARLNDTSVGSNSPPNSMISTNSNSDINGHIHTHINDNIYTIHHEDRVRVDSPPLPLPPLRIIEPDEEELKLNIIPRKKKAIVMNVNINKKL